MNELSVDDLAGRLGLVLQTALRVLNVLLPGGYSDPDDPDISVTREKVIGETALLLLASQPAAQQHPDLLPLVDRVGKALVPYARSDEVRMAICLEPALALDFGFAHLALSHLGMPDPSLDALIAKALRGDSASSHERLPYRHLEQEFIRRLAQPGRPDLRFERNMATGSMFARPQNVLTGTRDDVYGLTHALMYATGIGTCEPRLVRPVTAITDDLEAALARCLDDQDYDLGGEVLLGWPLLKRPWSPPASFGFAVLARVEDQVGFLPGPATRMERWRVLQGAERTLYSLATAYHTIYVMGLVCAAALQPGARRPGPVSGRGPAGATPAFLELMPPREGQPTWLEVLSELPARSQDRLAPLVMTICLRRAVTERDMATVHRCIKAAAAFGLTGYPSVRQAAQMLDRVITYSS